MRGATEGENTGATGRVAAAFAASKKEAAAEGGICGARSLHDGFESHVEAAAAGPREVPNSCVHVRGGHARRGHHGRREGCSDGRLDGILLGGEEHALHGGVGGRVKRQH